MTGGPTVSRTAGRAKEAECHENASQARVATTARNMTFYRIGFTSTFKAPIAFILCSIAAPVCLIVHMTRAANQPAHSPQQPALLERILRRRTSALSSAARIVQTATDACHV
jgi:hypothetical protein